MSEIVIICGLNGAGKSTVVKEFTDNKYMRFNRDELGGKLETMASLLGDYIKAGATNNFVLDNTYITGASRKSLIEIGKKWHIPVRAVWLKTSIEDCQVNCCMRMMERYGKILDPEEIKKSKDSNMFPIAVLFGNNKKFEPPTKDEGFAEVEERAFVRVWPKEHVNKGVFLDFDDTLRTSTGPNLWPEKPEHVKMLPGRTEVLKKWLKDGYILGGASNQSAVAKGLPIEDCKKCFDKTLELLGVTFEYQFCPHKIPPFSCYCRKPATGMGVYFIHKHKLKPSDCIFVGDSTSDKTFAKRCGFQFRTPVQFFGQ